MGQEKKRENAKSKTNVTLNRLVVRDINIALHRFVLVGRCKTCFLSPCRDAGSDQGYAEFCHRICG